MFNKNGLKEKSWNNKVSDSNLDWANPNSQTLTQIKTVSLNLGLKLSQDYGDPNSDIYVTLHHKGHIVRYKF